MPVLPEYRMTALLFAAPLYMMYIIYKMRTII